MGSSLCSYGVVDGAICINVVAFVLNNVFHVNGLREGWQSGGNEIGFLYFATVRTWASEFRQGTPRTGTALDNKTLRQSNWQTVNSAISIFSS